MRDKLIKSATFFQDLLSSYFHRMTREVVETLVLLCVSHLFGLYNPNQVANALGLAKACLYRELSSLSLYHAKSLNLRTFHQIQLHLTGERQTLIDFMTHFHEPNLKEP